MKMWMQFYVMPRTNGDEGVQKCFVGNTKPETRNPRLRRTHQGRGRKRRREKGRRNKLGGVATMHASRGIDATASARFLADCFRQSAT